jgi:hypothetical protein
MLQFVLNSDKSLLKLFLFARGLWCRVDIGKTVGRLHIGDIEQRTPICVIDSLQLFIAGSGSLGDR